MTQPNLDPPEEKVRLFKGIVRITLSRESWFEDIEASDEDEAKEIMLDEASDEIPSGWDIDERTIHQVLEQEEYLE